MKLKPLTLSFILAFSVALSASASAARLPDCGYISHRDDEIEEVYDLAYDLRHFLNVEKHIEYACSVLHGLENTLETEAQEYNDNVIALLETIRTDILNFRSPMIVYQAWYKVDGDDNLRQEKRRIYMKKSRRNIFEINEDLKRHLKKLERNSP